ncbi:hypothetical protein N431DRAFT_85780 [Stipitochalara longipes BDJ]|nr:hypothetical protein N431DRAFT_85780 [Stipitochalara longipes BDJ]
MPCKKNVQNTYYSTCLHYLRHAASSRSSHARTLEQLLYTPIHSCQNATLLPPNRPFRPGKSNAMFCARDHDRSPFLVLQSSSVEQMHSSQLSLRGLRSALLRTSCRWCGVKNAPRARAARSEQTERYTPHCPIIEATILSQERQVSPAQPASPRFSLLRKNPPVTQSPADKSPNHKIATCSTAIAHRHPFSFLNHIIQKSISA